MAFYTTEGIKPSKEREMQLKATQKEKQDIIDREEDSLKSLLTTNPQDLTRRKIDTALNRYKTTLLGGRAEEEVGAAKQTLLADATALAGKITARLQAFEKAQKTPGVSKQTKIVKPQTSLLG